MLCKASCATPLAPAYEATYIPGEGPWLQVVRSTPCAGPQRAREILRTARQEE